jgi:hypothetical protein
VAHLQRKLLRTHIVIDICCPAWGDLNTSIAVRSDGAHERPHLILLVPQNGTSVIAHNVDDSCRNPGTYSVTIMKTRNSGWNKSFGTESSCTSDTDLFQPCRIPSQFLINIKVGRIILILMGESMGDMRKCIQVRRRRPPGLESIKIGACPRVWVGRRGLWPEICATADWLRPFKWGIDLLGILDGTGCAFCGVNVVGIL